MENPQNKNYIPIIVLFTATVTAVLLLLILIPEFSVGGFDFRRANILSDIYTPSADSSKQSVEKVDTSYLLQDKILGESQSVADSTIVDTKNKVENKQAMPIVWGSGDSLKMDTLGEPQEAAEPIRIELPDSVLVPIEDYSAEGRALQSLFDYIEKGESMKRPVRIAVLGDSFIEGDIFTIDIRERLQDIFGGGGVGYMPLHSQVAAMRMSIKHDIDGVRTASIINANSADSLLKRSFPMTGKLFIPQEGASVKFSGVKHKRHLKRFSTARLLFTNRDSTEITITVNDTIVRSFKPEPGSDIQQIEVRNDIESIKYSFKNVDGFICYGAYLEESNGISIDNYSLRGSSGVQILASNSEINRKISEIVKIDLIILQYGLNVLSEEQKSYESYCRKMTFVVEHIKRSFPQTQILIMGVPDRNVRKEGKFSSISSIQSMITSQRQVAEKTGSMFWDTFRAMGGENSMSEFVARGWGAKDYAHINYSGGKYIAKAFVNALLWEKQNRYQTDVKKDSVEVDSSQNVVVVR